MKRVILVILVAVLVFGGVLLTLPGFIDWNKHREDIAKRLHDVTGHDYVIGGDIALAILPFPHVEIGGVKVSAPGGKEPLVMLERAEVSVALWPLMQGDVIVNSVVLVKPDIRIGIGADGKPSWTTAQLEKKPEAGAEKAEGGGLAGSVELKDIRVKEGSFRFSDVRSGKDYVLSDIDLKLHGDTLMGPYSAEGDFTYGGQDVTMTAKSGRLGDGDGSLSLQADIKIPSSFTSIVYSGIVDFKDGLEIQGETTVETVDPGSLALLAGAKAPDWLDKKLAVRGILTVDKKETALRNVNLTYAGVDYTGAMAFAPVREGKAAAIGMSLKASGPVDLDAILPSPSKEKKAAPAGFIPESFVLPSNLTVSAGLSAPSAVYKGVTFTDVKLKGGIAEKKVSGELSAGLSSRGNLQTSFGLTFGSSSKAGKEEGALTLSEPTLTYKTTLKTAGAEEMAKALMPGLKSAAWFPLLRGGLSVTAEGSVKPDSVSVSSGSLSINQTEMAGSGSFRKGASGGRGALKAEIASESIDLDNWIKVLGGEKKDSKPSTMGETVRGVVEKISLPFDLDATVSLKDIRYGDRPYDSFGLLAKLTGGKLELKTLELKDKDGNGILVAGTIGDVKALKDIDLSAQGKTADLKAFLSGLSADVSGLPENVKEAELLSEFKGQADKLSFTANLKALRGSAEVSGALADVLEKPKVSDLTVRLKHPNYVELIRLTNPEFSGGTGIPKTLDVFATMKREGDLYSLDGLEATVGPTRITGEASVDLSDKKPSIAANLQLTDTPLDQLLGHDAGSKGTVKAQRPVSQQPQDVRWSRDALDMGWMNKFNLVLNATAEKLSYGNWAVSGAVVGVALKDGTMTVSKIDGGMYGGKATLSGKITAPPDPRQPLSFDGKASLQNVSLEALAGSFSGAKTIRAKGNVSLETEVAAAGISPAALVFDLHGKGKADGKELVFEGFDLARLSRTLAQPSSSGTENLTALLDVTMSGGRTAFDKLTAAFTITEGVMNFSDLTLTGPDATVKTLGNINLPLWTVDLNSTIDLVEPADAPDLKVAFKGPLDNPGQTFGKSAMDSYFQQMIGKKLENLLLDKLQEEGILPGAKKQQPAPEPELAPSAGEGGQTAQPQTQLQTQKQQKQKPKEIQPEDVLNDVLQGILQGQ